MHNISYLRRFLKPYRSLVSWTVLFLILARVAGALDPIWLKKIIDSLTNVDHATPLTVLIVTYFGLKAATALFEYLRDLIFAPAEMGITRTLSEVLFEHLLGLPMKYHVDQKIGGISRQIARGTRAITFILDFLVINILPTVAALIITTALLFRYYAPEYAIITAATVILYTWFTIWTTEKRQKFRLGANLADDEVAAIEVDGLSNIDTIKYFNNEALMMKRYKPAAQNRYQLALTSNQLFALISGGQALILLLGLGALLLLAVRQAQAGTMTIGDLVLLTTYVVQLSAPITMLGFVYRNLKDGIADIDGIATILQEEVDIPEPAHPQTIAEVRGALSFTDVGFGYKSRPNVLKDITFDVKPGQRVAFVGPSGVGKSTIVKLLFRIYDPVSGQIVIDDVPLDQLAKEARRSIFAIVPQEPALFNATIAENIRFGKPDATDAEVAEAVETASLTKLIARLPDGYQTVVGERGVKLSGGEKQRVAIARAIIRNPKILVFDEATSSLDSQSERDIQNALDAASAHRTTIAVAHRLSTIAGYDQIYVLGEGRIVEHGTHAELLALEGAYAKLWKLQARHKHEVTVEPAEEIS